ncbi:FtsK/SpoIIIE domain-containing protein [[Limnothrix rosea] IAM M-220]|uniref:FtsK/SpoIIIE domain-containing protein n=1 Tax=[Limnothrix rosea] IAM M-220 TaxID=454133 RepID=UPI001C0A984F|nr:FtsK/SpoIIIE domain-containing protein [[Limnothrix rosea] IAM M-220]
MSNTICFKLNTKSNNKSQSKNFGLFRLTAYEQLLNSLQSTYSDFSFSIRHLYNPSEEEKLKSFILISSGSNSPHTGSAQVLAGQLKGSLGRWYEVKEHKIELFDLFDWVGSISHLCKFGEFVNSNDLSTYVPHPLHLPKIFEYANDDDDFILLDFLEENESEKLIVDIVLSRDKSLEQNHTLSKAIKESNQILERNKSTKNIDKIYEYYQSHYLENPLFNYSIRALGANAIDTVAILTALNAILTQRNNNCKSLQLYSFDAGNFLFKDGLDAAHKAQAFTGFEWHGWNTEQGKNLENQHIKKTRKSKGLLSTWDDGSLDIPEPVLTFEESLQAVQEQKLLSSISDKNQSGIESKELVLRGSSALSKAHKAKIPTIANLKPLHHLTTYSEFSKFIRFFASCMPEQQQNACQFQDEEIFTKYRHLITKDTYIVGLDDNEEPVLSSWAEIPHRLIAGLPGSGKTNFLNWIVFQFLFVNPRRKIYISDFGGVDFQYLQDLNLNVEIVDELDDCVDFVEKIHQEEYERRLGLMKQYKVSNIKSLEQEGVDIDRTLWIIDEAADIADAQYKVKGTIEKRLKEYARKGRKYGIQVLYCTQRPTTEVVSKQVTDQCEEKNIFRVSPDASQRMLNDAIAGTITPDQRGRCWLDGHAGRMFVNVPKIEKPEGSTIAVEDTLWRHFIK